MFCTFNGDCMSGDCHNRKCVSSFRHNLGAMGEGMFEKKSDGMFCTFNGDCMSGDCHNSKCVSSSRRNLMGGGLFEKKSDGEFCTFNGDCMSGDCHNSKCASSPRRNLMMLLTDPSTQERRLIDCDADPFIQQMCDESRKARNSEERDAKANCEAQHKNWKYVNRKDRTGIKVVCY